MTMRVLFLALALLLSVPPVGEAQETRRPIRIGVLNAAFAASHPTVEGLKAGLAELFDLAVRSQLKVTIGGRYPLESAGEAHRALESRRTAGKLVLIP